MRVMSLCNENSWPSQVIEHLTDCYELFLNWEEAQYERVTTQEYDQAIFKLQSILRTERGLVLRGYHCTRLTDFEIHDILTNGMQLPNMKLLHQRIEALKIAELIDSNTAETFKTRNQASDPHRAGRLWFCFFSPHNAGQRGIERFFRSWGGEALYNSHERNPVLGRILNQIGTPCIVEAYIPISSLSRNRLSFVLVTRFLANRGCENEEYLALEDYVLQPIPSQNIARVMQFPEDDFVQLTKCDAWNPPLAQ